MKKEGSRITFDDIKNIKGENFAKSLVVPSPDASEIKWSTLDFTNGKGIYKSWNDSIWSAYINSNRIFSPDFTSTVTVHFVYPSYKDENNDIVIITKKNVPITASAKALLNNARVYKIISNGITFSNVNYVPVPYGATNYAYGICVAYGGYAADDTKLIYEIYNTTLPDSTTTISGIPSNIIGGIDAPNTPQDPCIKTFYRIIDYGINDPDTRYSYLLYL